LSNPKTRPETNHQQLIDTFTFAIYQNSTLAVFFHTAVAEQIGLGATEEKTLLILSGGPLTAGEIAQKTGLTTPSVTSLIDRLERKGFVRRVRDLHDRRRVFVEVNQARLAELMQVFASLQGTFEDLIDGYSDEQVETILSFLNRSIARSQEAIALLRQRQENKDENKDKERGDREAQSVKQST
jgi:DNA-binding MarR family transcriptional regulator